MKVEKSGGKSKRTKNVTVAPRVLDELEEAIRVGRNHTYNKIKKEKM